MTSREIIIKLIDDQLIGGEEAYVLLNDIFKAEMVAVNETLKEANKNSSIDWSKINIEPSWLYSPSSTGTYSISSTGIDACTTTRSA